MFPHQDLSSLSLRRNPRTLMLWLTVVSCNLHQGFLPLPRRSRASFSLRIYILTCVIICSIRKYWRLATSYNMQRLAGFRFEPLGDWTEFCVRPPLSSRGCLHFLLYYLPTCVICSMGYLSNSVYSIVSLP